MRLEDGSVLCVCLRRGSNTESGLYGGSVALGLDCTQGYNWCLESKRPIRDSSEMVMGREENEGGEAV